MTEKEISTAGFIGRVLLVHQGEARLRLASGDVLLRPAGEAKAGDWVRVFEEGRACELVKSEGLAEFPRANSELARMDKKRVEGLWSRARLLTAVRQYFTEEGFLEVETPTLVPAPGMEVNIKAVEAGNGYLITSPEFSMKRLLVAGLEKIYAMPRCFRAEEEGAHHGQEFTMLEWYRAWEGLDAIEEDVRQLLLAAAGDGGCVKVEGRSIDLAAPWIRLSVDEAFEQWAGGALSGKDASALRRQMLELGVQPFSDSAQWDELFYQLWVEKIDPKIAEQDRVVLINDWPLPLAALARKHPDKEHCALRFEVYVGGVELANAFDELTDAQEQRQRFVEEQQLRKERGLAVYPLDEKFLLALEEGMPPSSGIALGIDRLAMLAAGAEDISQVSAFTSREL